MNASSCRKILLFYLCRYFLWIFCRVQSLGSSAEPFDKPSPRHLFTQTRRYPKRYNYPPFLFFIWKHLKSYPFANVFVNKKRIKINWYISNCLLGVRFVSKNNRFLSIIFFRSSVQWKVIG